MGGKSKPVTVGYEYFMGLHMGLCYGPIDALLEIDGGGRTAWQGTVTESTTITISAPNLYGGKEKEGGLSGPLDVMMGEPTQAPNAYLTDKIGANRPAYRGLFTVVYNGGSIAANNPYVKPWSFMLRRIRKGWKGDACWYPAKAEIRLVGGIVGGPPGWMGGYEIDKRVLASGEYTTLAIANRYGLSSTETDTSWVFFRPLDFVIQATKAGEYWNSDMDAAAGFVALGLQYNQTAVLRFLVGEPRIILLTQTSTPPAAPDGTSWNLQDSGTTALGPTYMWSASMEIGTESTPGKPPIIAMNPAHIVYQCLTDPEWGMGYDASIIDGASFQAAADTFFAEGLGLCLQWARQDSIENFIQLVLDHAGASLVEDRRTLLWKLVPIRGNYDPGTLPHYSDAPAAGEYRILELTRFERSALTDATNELTLSYTDIATGEPGSVTVQNLAAVQAAGRVISQSRDYPGLPVSSLAVRTAMRDLRAATSGLAKVQLVLDRNGYDLLPGQVIRWSWSPDGIVEMVLRVVSIDYGSLTDGRVRVDCVEDVFGLPATTYAQVPPIGWEEPDTTAQNAHRWAVFEAPFRELIQTIGRAEAVALPNGTGYVATVAQRGPGVNLNFKSYASVPGLNDEPVAGDWAGVGVLASGIGPLDTEITLLDDSDLSRIVVGTAAFLAVQPEGYDPFDAEIVRVDAIDPVAKTVTIARGCLDTTPRPWEALTTALWGYDEYSAASALEWAEGEEVICRIVTHTTTEDGNFFTSPDAKVVLANRAARPYPPGKLRVTDAIASDVAYPSECVGELTLGWVHRDRLLQDDRLIESEQASIGPEPGVTYTVRFYVDDVLDAEQTGITGTSSTPYTMTAAGVGRVEVWAVRDDLESWQAAAATFQYYVTPYDTLITDAGENLITDAGDNFITG